MTPPATPTPENELSVLVGLPEEMHVGGEILALKPLKIGQIPPFLRAISPVMAQLAGPHIDWLAVFGQRGEDLLSAIAIAIGKPRAWVDDLPPDEAVLLAARVIEVNADFFTRQVLPKLDALFSQARDLAPAAATVPAGSRPFRA